MNQSQPKVSIITVCFQAAPVLEKTILSVIGQTYGRKEYLVIDGGSDDGTAHILRKYAHAIDQVVSEKDAGIYDAMNKGVRLATGDYILFLNADDTFASPEALTQMLKLADPSSALIYGDHIAIYQTLQKIKKAQPLENIWKHMCFSHQALLTKREILLRHPFDLRYKVASDFHFIFTCYQSGYQFEHVPVQVVRFGMGGVSDQQVLRGYRENYQIVRQHHPSWKIHWYHRQHLFVYFWWGKIRQWLPNSLYEKLMYWKNQLMPGQYKVKKKAP
jgi:glycosyltransferase involved in cell wall biosynthesis